MSRSVISFESRPRLAAKARVRLDRQTGRYVLLYPERGLELNSTAAEIVKLCTGEYSVDDIIARLIATRVGVRADVERDVVDFLDRLGARGLLDTT